MKLAQALKLRKDLTTKLETAANDARLAAFTPGAKPSADDRVKKCFYLQSLILQLSDVLDTANMTTGVQFDGRARTLSSLRTERDRLTETIKALTPLAGVGTQTLVRGAQTRDDEGKVVRTPDVVIPVQFDLTVVSARINEACKRVRLLDAALQQANWLTEVTCPAADAEL